MSDRPVSIEPLTAEEEAFHEWLCRTARFSRTGTWGTVARNTIIALRSDAARSAIPAAEGLDVDVLRHGVVQASIYLANGDTMAAHEELAIIHARLRSKEPTDAR